MAHWACCFCRGQCCIDTLGSGVCHGGWQSHPKRKLTVHSQAVSVANGSSVRCRTSCLPCSSIFKTCYLFFGSLIHENTVFRSYLLLKPSSNASLPSSPPVFPPLVDLTSAAFMLVGIEHSPLEHGQPTMGTLFPRSHQLQTAPCLKMRPISHMSTNICEHIQHLW